MTTAVSEKQQPASSVGTINQLTESTQGAAIARVEAPKTSLAPRPKQLSLNEIKELGEIFVASGMFKDVQNLAQAVVKIKAGQELGFEPFVSMGGVHIIQGKAVLSATLKASVIKDSGRYRYEVKRLDHEGCTLVFFEYVGNAWKVVGESTFTMEDARAAGLAKPPNSKDVGMYEKYGRNMLFSRALTNGMSWYCPDLLRCADGNDADVAAFDADQIIGDTAGASVQNVSIVEPALGRVVDGEIVEEKSPEERRTEKVEHIQQLCKWLNEHKDSIAWTKANLTEFVNLKYNVTDGISALAFKELDEMIAELTERLDALTKETPA